MTPTTNLGWLRGPLWDVALVAFGWVPFYVWVAIDSAGTSNWLTDGGPGFVAAVAVALAFNFVHRQYVLILVYGDREALAERPRAYVIAPLLALAIVGGAIWSGHMQAQFVVLTLLGAWNAWHVIQQRYGLMRVYASRAKGGLESRAAARLDRGLLWSSVLVATCATALWQTKSLEGIPQASLLFQIIHVVLSPYFFKIALGVALLIWLLVAWRWLKTERSATPTARWPRWIFGLSTLALLTIFVVHGPVVGYIVLGVAHSLEYLAFVHVFCEKKYNRGTSSVAAFLLGSVQRAPLILAPLLLAYVFLYNHRYALAYVTYYSTTSALHYLYDGWIWRLRKPQVARPIGAMG